MSIMRLVRIVLVLAVSATWLIGLPSQAAPVVVDLTDKGEVSVRWGELMIAPPQKPALRTVELLDWNYQPLPAGTASPLSAVKKGAGIVFASESLPSRLGFFVEYAPAGENALDLTVRLQCGAAETAEGAASFIDHLAVSLLTVRMRNPPERVGLLYPAGNYGYVPAQVFQGNDYAVGVSLLGLHEDGRLLFTNLSGNKDGEALRFELSTSWSQLFMIRGKGTVSYERHLHLTFGPSREGGSDVASRPELWKEYRDELNRRWGSIPPPKFAPGRPVLMTGLSTRMEWITPENPMGWEYFNIKKGAKYWEERGFTAGGPPENWIIPLADEMIRQMRRIDAQGLIIWNTCMNPLGGNLNYIAEADWFHPQLEKRLPVGDAAVNWDCLTADVEVVDGNGAVLARRTGTELQAVGEKQRIDFRRNDKEKTDDLTDAGNRLIDEKHKWVDGNHQFITAAGRVRLPLWIADARAVLVGLKADDEFSLPGVVATGEYAVTPQSLAKSNLKLKGVVRKVERTLINSFVKRIHDAGFESGFINRGGFTCGVPWRQIDLDFDWTSEWQYRLFADRFKSFEERFGEKCRWFYVDTFGGNEPGVVYRRLRADFPNLFIASEHEYDLTHRLLGTSLVEAPPSALERLLNPNYVALVRTSTLKIPGGMKAEELIAKDIISNPNAIALVQPHVIEAYLRALDLAGKKRPEGK